MNKKFFLIGFLLIMIILIPLIAYYVSTQRTKLPTKAAKSTNLSFILPPDAITPGKTFNMDIQLDPGTNQVSFVRLVISYNPQKLAPADTTPLTKNDSIFGVLLEGPTLAQCTGNTCTMTIAMGISPDSGKPIQGVPAIIGTVRFKALQITDTAPTNVSFGNGTQVLSLASQDATSENVLAGAPPIAINIVNISPTPTTATGNTPTPTSISATGSTSTPTPTSGAGSNTLTCTGFTASPTSGNPPLQIAFTLIGSENNGSAKITKATVNFGDGNVQDITTGGGIGTGSVNTQISHTYQTAGTYTANAAFTDTAGIISDSTTCQQTLTIGPGISISPTPSQQPSGSITPTGITPVPSLMKTGPEQTIVGIGIASGVAAVVGTALLFGL